MFKTIRSKLLGASLLLLVAVVGLGVFSGYTIARTNARVATIVQDRVVPLRQLKSVSDMYAVNIVDTAHKLLAHSLTPRQAAENLTTATATVKSQWTAYKATFLTPEEKILAERVDTSKRDTDAAVAELSAIIAADNRAALDAFVTNRLYPAVDPTTDALGKLADLQIRVAEQEYAAALVDKAVAFRIFAAVGMAALGAFGVTLFVVIRRVSDPLSAMADSMGQIAGGDLEVDIPGAGQDNEIGQMAKALEAFRAAAEEKLRLERAAEEARRASEVERANNEAARAEAARLQAVVLSSMAGGLEKLAGGDLTFRIEDAFASDYEKLRCDFNEAMEQLQGTMRVVAATTQSIRAGAGEIGEAADNLSRRTEQQAASLEETAAAMDEITATVQRTAEGAGQAHQTVGVARSDADRSEQVVTDTVAAMGEIERSAQQISQIIGVIDEIAFQTNLLALNAGVEAARAGDSGRGFAVVAQEVRALAQRSAEAAREIKGLIAASGNHVTAGVSLVGETGAALKRIQDQVLEIASVVSNIAASAQEQATGLAQVNMAVNQMDQMTQQNAAMVEESTAASHSLTRETAELSRLISRFRTEGDAAAPTVAVASAAGLRAPATRAPGGAALKVVDESWSDL